MMCNEGDYDAKPIQKVKNDWMAKLVLIHLNLRATNKILPESTDFRSIPSLKMDKNIFKVCLINFSSH